jgi:hypothetical protein
MQGWDGWVHVNPLGLGVVERDRGTNGTSGKRRSCHRAHCNDNVEGEVAVAMLFNPTDVSIHANVSIPVYYAALDVTATVSVNNGPPSTVAVTRDYMVEVELVMPPRTAHTVVLGQG